MQELTLTTPALLFSAISLLLLAYTNRFLGYAALVRTLFEQFKNNPDSVLKEQISNLRKRIHLTRRMQVLGVSSLFLCVITMFLIYIGYKLIAVFTFAMALLLLILSLGISIYEIIISVKSIDLHLNDMEKG